MSYTQPEYIVKIKEEVSKARYANHKCITCRERLEFHKYYKIWSDRRKLFMYKARDLKARMNRRFPK